MLFLDRDAELRRLDQLADPSGEGGLAVVYGRRRIGKTRLLLEWTKRHRGVYCVADQSAPEIQRRYLAEALAEALSGFADVAYPDWSALLARVGRDAEAHGFRGPLVIDELPYLVAASPELPSILQRFVDRDASAARLVIALAGSSQRMMQGLVLDAGAPLYGRARVVLDLQPLELRFVEKALQPSSATDLVRHYAAWGGVPRYLELAREASGSVEERIDELVLDPLGPLHREPDRLLLEEIPSALEVRPVLDAIGGGANRVSEIGGRLGRPATSMARPLERLVGMGLVRREVPFGSSEKGGRRSLYKIHDPHFRLWFRVVAPHRGQLAAGTRAARLATLRRFWPSLVAEAWEDLCRAVLPRLDVPGLREVGPLGSAFRWWHGAAPEWDLVAASLDGRALVLGEIKWHDRPVTARDLRREAARLRERPAPGLDANYLNRQQVRVLFVPAVEGRLRRSIEGVLVVTARDLLRARKS
ncbi:MAG TPA: ATP-binding protein [Thermoanaerobaculia bacterium]|nr:ATP-binding protein [Thermoanaerobaculia bacterium]